MSIARARQHRKQMPPSEAVMWNALRTLKSRGYHFRRQVPLGRYYADFACHHPRVVIEVDGWTHDAPEYDAVRDEFLRREGYRVLRVTNEDVLRNLDGVVGAVLAALGAKDSD